MICPRCGTVNAPARATCSRCQGSLAAVARDESPLPMVLPMTRRAELSMAGARQRLDGGDTGTAHQVPGAQETDREPPYVLTSERSGQPAPPPSNPQAAEPARPDGSARNDRFVPRLSPAP